MTLRNVFKIVLVLLVIACNSSDNNNRIIPESTTYEFFEGSKITLAINQTSETFEIEPGANTVFKYIFNAEDNLDIADDEYSEVLYFEVDGNLNSFSFTNNELQVQNLFIRHLCFCASNDFVFTDIGTVSGTKLTNGNWDVDISITFKWDEFSETESRNISGIFRPGEL